MGFYSENSIPNTDGTRYSKRKIGVIIVVAVLLAAYLIYAAAKNSLFPFGSGDQDTYTPGDSTGSDAMLRTYTNEVYSFTIKYDAAYRLDETRKNQIIFVTPESDPQGFRELIVVYNAKEDVIEKGREKLVETLTGNMTISGFPANFVEGKAGNFYQKIIFIPREEGNRALVLISNDASGIPKLEHMLSTLTFTD